MAGPLKDQAAGRDVDIELLEALVEEFGEAPLPHRSTWTDHIKLLRPRPKRI